MLAQKSTGLAAIAVDEVPAARGLTERLKLDFPLLSDPGGASAIKAFGVFDEANEIAWPAIFIINADGTIAKRWLADTYKERISTPDVLADL